MVAAAKLGSVGLVASLLERGAADMNSKDEEGCTLLVAGCYSGSTDLVKLLIERGADINMLAGGTIGGVSGFITPLCMALGLGHREVAALLIKHGADINALGLEFKSGVVTVSITPLMLTVATGLQHATKVLLECGAEVDKEAEASRGQESVSVTALMYAATAEVAKLLLDHGAQVNFQASRGGRTALMWASAQGRYEVTKLLLKRGAEVDLQDSDGRTAFMYQVANNKANTVRLLTQYEASIDINTKRGETVPVVAGERGLTDIAELLTKPATTKDVETHTESVESESVASESAPDIHSLVSMVTSMFQVSNAKLDTIIQKVDNFDSRLSRVERDVAMVTASAVSSLQSGANVRVEQQAQDQQVQCVVGQSETLTVVPTSNNAAPQQEDPAPQDVAEAHTILEPLASEWENIGMYLRIPDHKMKAIKIEQLGVLRNCLRELLIVWLRGVAPPPSWRALAEAVGKVDERVAREIRNRHTR